MVLNRIKWIRQFIFIKSEEQSIFDFWAEYYSRAEPPYLLALRGYGGGCREERQRLLVSITSKLCASKNAVANTWSNMHVEPAAWPGEWRAQMKIMKINKLWKFVIIFLLLSFILYLKKIKKIITLFICIATHLWIYIFIPALFKGNVPSSTILIYK